MRNRGKEKKKIEQERAIKRERWRGRELQTEVCGENEH